MKKKYLVILTICFSMIASTILFAMEKVDTELFYCGQNIKLKNAIYVENSEYYIPLRECAEQINATVNYIPHSMITVNLADGREIKYTLNATNDIKNINGVSYISANDFYDKLYCDVFEVDYNNKKLLRVTGKSGILNNFQINKSNFDFSISLLNQMEKNENTVISPISLKLALIMVSNCTTGQTQQEILNVLESQYIPNVSNWIVEETNGDYKKEPNEGKIQFANSLWYNSEEQNAIFNENFQNHIKSSFGGSINAFTNDTVKENIHKWIAQQTNGMIQEITQQNEIENALISTIYFKCSWKNQFYTNETKKDIFYNIDNTKSEIDFMNQIDSAYYCQIEDWQMLGLPYSDKNYTMYLFLSEKGNQINNDIINKLLMFQEYKDVNITIPKINIEKEYNLTKVLNEMGIKAMFQNDSDFNAMYADGKGKCITSAIQKTKIIADEKGTESASATIMSREQGGSNEVPPKFVADRPFTYMITKNIEYGGQKEVLFIGQYVTGNK